MEGSGHEVIDFSALDRELRGAVEEDRRYQRENDAKLRAVTQRVGSYEEFRDIVLACHLQPLDRKEKMDAARRQPWNPLVTPGNTQRPLVTPGNTQRPLVTPGNTQRPLVTPSNTQRPLVTPSNTRRPLVTPSNTQRPLVTPNKP